jgi:hypothetical protein
MLKAHVLCRPGWGEPRAAGNRVAARPGREEPEAKFGPDEQEADEKAGG